MLIGEDYELAGAQNGEEALRVVSDSPPDLILLDVMMPGIDGFSVCERLKQDDKTREVVVVIDQDLSVRTTNTNTTSDRYWCSSRPIYALSYLCWALGGSLEGSDEAGW